MTSVNILSEPPPSVLAVPRCLIFLQGSSGIHVCSWNLGRISMYSVWKLVLFPARWRPRGFYDQCQHVRFFYSDGFFPFLPLWLLFDWGFPKLTGGAFIWHCLFSR